MPDLGFPVDLRVYQEGQVQLAVVHQDFETRFKTPPHPRSISAAQELPPSWGLMARTGTYR